jgi:hypothetical protein
VPQLPASYSNSSQQLNPSGYLTNSLTHQPDRAIAQAVSRRLPTSAARVPAQVRSCGICGGQSGTGAHFLRVLRFPLPILIPPTAPHSSSSIIRGWYNRPNSGRRTKRTQSHPTPRTKLKKKPDSPTNSTPLTDSNNCPIYNISVRTAQKTPFHYCCAIVAVETCFFVKPLLSNDCCIPASCAVVA